MDMFPNYTRNHCCVITNQILVDKTKLTNSVNKLYILSKTSYTEAVLMQTYKFRSISDVKFLCAEYVNEASSLLELICIICIGFGT